MKTCIACGMPMHQPEDFAQGNPEKGYCRYCARPDGTMHSYEERLTGMTQFIIKTQGLEPGAAENAARQMMSKLPAWQGR